MTEFYDTSGTRKGGVDGGHKLITMISGFTYDGFVSEAVAVDNVAEKGGYRPKPDITKFTLALKRKIRPTFLTHS